MPDSQSADRYIGDGVYASFDGYQIWLKTQRGDGLIHEIALEWQTLVSLNQYADAIRGEKAAS